MTERDRMLIDAVTWQTIFGDAAPTNRELVVMTMTLGYVKRTLLPIIEQEALADLAARIVAAVEDGTLGLSTDAHHLVRAVPDGVACVCGQYDDADHGIEASELWRSHLIAAARAAVLVAIREASDDRRD